MTTWSSNCICESYSFHIFDSVNSNADWFYWTSDHGPVGMVAGEPTYRDEYLISDAVRIMVDKMCYLAVFGGKAVFETKVPASTQAQFNK